MAGEGASAASVTYEKGRLYQLPVGDIKPNPNQPRKYFGEEELAELTQSIKDKGVLQPILLSARRAPSSSLLPASGASRPLRTQA